MSKKLSNLLSDLTDNDVENLATYWEERIWLNTDAILSDEDRDKKQREIYNELIRIKEL
jgi:hypothetical protein